MNKQVTKLVRLTQEMQNRALQAQQESNSAAVAAQRKAIEQMTAMFETERAANAARFAAENAARLATEEAKKKAEEADAERQPEEERKRADEAIARAEAARKAAEKATAAKDDAERRLKEGIQPAMTPTAQEIRAAQANIQYQENLSHFAVAGRAGAGKSSLVNGFRGMTNHEACSAQTGVTETTMTLGRYPDPDEQCLRVWYDLPGAGTTKIPDWQYFNAQGLYVFDCIVVLFDNRFTDADIAILLNCRRFQIPAYIVRSKADQCIQNIMNEMGYDSEDDGVDRMQQVSMYASARERFINETRRNVKANLADANLPDQKVYIVSSNCLRAVAKGRQPKRVIDEIHLSQKLTLQEASDNAHPLVSLVMH
ncbi:hypothetical protein K503DRAFT_791802 [Rhizopogon vinicolor AM-OR11-026]|uniref:IRG-type G domain-containing protein n=1 Tax=Rhizopogon vinicolor AM-OR11-026 TaxID=1314800 RepID=A0A1B7N4D8_9AGAM|nr:hypothetical protein K503DRAFT_791802 [Rhizopogon vinicolor AM-OR11-026]